MILNTLSDQPCMDMWPAEPDVDLLRAALVGSGFNARWRAWPWRSMAATPTLWCLDVLNPERPWNSEVMADWSQDGAVFWRKFRCSWLGCGWFMEGPQNASKIPGLSRWLLASRYLSSGSESSCFKNNPNPTAQAVEICWTLKPHLELHLESQIVDTPQVRCFTSFSIIFPFFPFFPFFQWPMLQPNPPFSDQGADGADRLLTKLGGLGRFYGIIVPELEYSHNPSVFTPPFQGFQGFQGPNV